MIVTKWKGTQKIAIPIKNYKIDWSKAPSKGQQVVQDFLYDFWRHDIVIAEMRIPGCMKRFDIVNCSKKIIIEYSPISHHGNFSEFFHKNRAQYLKSIKSDIDKIAWAERNGFKIAEITEADLIRLSEKWFELAGIIL